MTVMTVLPAVGDSGDGPASGTLTSVCRAEHRTLMSEDAFHHPDCGSAYYDQQVGVVDIDAVPHNTKFFLEVRLDGEQ